MDVVVYIRDQHTFKSETDSCSMDVDGTCLQVFDDDAEEVIFAYALQPGQYLKVQTSDDTMTVRVND